MTGKLLIDKLLMIINSSSRKVRESLADSITMEEASILLRAFNKSDINEFLSISEKKIRTSYERNWRAPDKAVLSRCFNSFYIYIPSEKVFITLCAANPPVTIQYL
jgi:hypothetical protein